MVSNSQATTVAKSVVGTALQPDYSAKVNITSNSYTAPSNGIVYAYALLPTTEFSSYTITVNNVNVAQTNYSGPSGGYNLQESSSIPVGKGDTVKFALAGTGASWNWRIFVPYK